MEILDDARLGLCRLFTDPLTIFDVALLEIFDVDVVGNNTFDSFDIDQPFDNPSWSTYKIENCLVLEELLIILEQAIDVTALKIGELLLSFL